MLMLAGAAVLVASPMAAGKIDGHATVNGKAATLTFVAATTAENLFDEKQRDIVVLVADKPIPPDINPGDDVTVSLHARTGEFRAVMFRIDPTKKLLNVKLFEKGLPGLLSFGARDFELIPAAIDAKHASGRLHTKAPTTFDGTTLDFDATFDAIVGGTHAPAPAGRR